MWYWSPALSRLLKFGKTLVDPRQVTGIRDMTQAVLNIAACLACQYRCYRNIPIIGAFVERYDNGWALEEFAPRVKEEFVSHHVSATRLIPPDGSLWTQFASIYGVAEEDLHWIHDAVLSSQPWTFIEHPAIVQMARVDYDP